MTRLEAAEMRFLRSVKGYTEWHKKTGTSEKTQQKLKKSKKKNLLTEIEPLELAF